MTKLSDTQAILLSTASQRVSGSLLPLPASLKSGGGTGKAIEALLNRGLIEERATSEASAVSREYSDTRFGVFITATGFATIGVERDGADSVKHTPVAAPAPPAKTGKTAAVLNLLHRPNGATMAELIEATAWLPHTTRAALTGLRKKGHAIERTKRDDVTCYRIVAAG